MSQEIMLPCSECGELSSELEQVQFATGSMHGVCPSCMQKLGVIETPNPVWGGTSYVVPDWCKNCPFSPHPDMSGCVNADGRFARYCGDKVGEPREDAVVHVVGPSYGIGPDGRVVEFGYAPSGSNFVVFSHGDHENPAEYGWALVWGFRAAEGSHGSPRRLSSWRISCLATREVTQEELRMAREVTGCSHGSFLVEELTKLL